ncbi:hypothetical protein ACT80S_13195 [Ramlibacter sp. MAHUQ-53]|uniref:hypothetical protein n=1 Tax=unclassified Ramlibacter TaxID=2617605 RepID=UPI0036392CCF
MPSAPLAKRSTAAAGRQRTAGLGGIGDGGQLEVFRPQEAVNVGFPDGSSIEKCDPGSSHRSAEPVRFRQCSDDRNDIQFQNTIPL